VERDQWRPEKANHFSLKKEPLQFLSINDDSDTIIMVTRRETLVGWAQTSAIVDTNWILYLAYYHAPDKACAAGSIGSMRQSISSGLSVKRGSLEQTGWLVFPKQH